MFYSPENFPSTFLFSDQISYIHIYPQLEGYNLLDMLNPSFRREIQIARTHRPVIFYT